MAPAKARWLSCCAASMILTKVHIELDGIDLRDLAIRGATQTNDRSFPGTGSIQHDGRRKHCLG